MFIILSNGHEWEKMIYNNGDLLGQGVYFHNRFPYNGESKAIEVMCKLHTNWKITKKFNLPFKSVWYKKMIEKIPGDNDTVFLIAYDGTYAAFDQSFYKVLSERFPHSKIYKIYIFTTIVRYSFAESAGYFPELMNKFDLVLSYDEGDIKKHGITKTMSNLFLYNVQDRYADAEIKSDIFYVGNAKLDISSSRLDYLYGIARKALENDLKLDFWISGVPKEKQLEIPGITYNTPMHYCDVLNHVASSRCNLEVIQDGQVSGTIRFMESITCRRKYITNCPATVNKPYYDSDYISILTDPSKLDAEFVRNTPSFDYNSVPMNNIFDFFEFIKKSL